LNHPDPSEARPGKEIVQYFFLQEHSDPQLDNSYSAMLQIPSGKEGNIADDFEFC
jgi:hypothetical protein